MSERAPLRTDDKRFLFEKDSVPHALTVMALPAVASQLITLIYNMADTWFVGRTNNPYMVASCSLVLPVFMMTIVISNIFGSGGGTLIARLIGSGQEEEASLRIGSLYLDGSDSCSYFFTSVLSGNDTSSALFRRERHGTFLCEAVYVFCSSSGKCSGHTQ